MDPTARWQPPEEWHWRNLLKSNEIYLQKVAVIGAENSATFMHAGYSNILRRTEGGRKKTTTENQRFSVVFYGLMDPSVIRVGLEPTTPTLKVFVAPRHLKASPTARLSNATT